LRVYFPVTILLPATAPPEGRPLRSQEHYIRRFASQHLRTLGHSIGTDSDTNSDKAKTFRAMFIYMKSARRHVSGEDRLSSPSKGVGNSPPFPRCADVTKGPNMPSSRGGAQEPSLRKLSAARKLERGLRISQRMVQSFLPIKKSSLTFWLTRNL
jgi:hypothetical protein